MHRLSRNVTLAGVIVWAVVLLPAALATRDAAVPDVVGRADVDGAVADLESSGFDVTVVRHQPPGTPFRSDLMDLECASPEGASVIVAERAWRFGLLPLKDWVVLYVCELPAIGASRTASLP